jgi:hypothetical protein
LRRLLNVQRLLLVCFAVILVAASACGEEAPVAVGDAVTTTTSGRSTDAMEPGALDSPPPVTVRSPSTALTLHPWTFCYKNGCADGFPPAEPPDVGSADELAVEFPLKNWQFTATFKPEGVNCPRQHVVPLPRGADDTFALRPAGPAGTYEVTLAGQGEGDLFVSFQWTTPRDGPMPTPEARLAIVADHDGQPDSYGVELVLSNLASTPIQSSAEISVTSAGGRSITFEPTVASRCIAEGTVYWDGPDDQGRAAAQLGEPPFTYDVEVTLDGISYRASATWPTDQIPGNEPSVALEFSPPLPSL